MAFSQATPGGVCREDCADSYVLAPPLNQARALKLSVFVIEALLDAKQGMPTVIANEALQYSSKEYDLRQSRMYQAG